VEEKMAKISPVSSKYIIHSTIEIEGVVDRPDVIGAIFGQTEGLLGTDLELRELQRSGRIGRIEVDVETRNGKTKGNIIIPSSLDMAETAIVGAALEIIQRIGPCNAKVKVRDIEDVRVSKRNFVVDRAKELLKNMIDKVMPDSQEIADEVAYSVRVMEIQTFGRERLPAGPAIDESDEIVLVEGRADVINLLKHGFKNAIALNGTSVPQTIIELSKKKVITAFLDGDRGGKLIIRELTAVAEVDYVTFAPDGKEVEEITKKEIHKALRSKISAEQAKLEMGIKSNGALKQPAPPQQKVPPKRGPAPKPAPAPAKKAAMSPDEQKKFKEMIENLVGTRGAYILDDKLNILGKLPISELVTTLKSLSSGVYAVLFDGTIEKDLVQVAEKTGVTYLIGMESKVKDARCVIKTLNDF
jgi:DNA primase